MTETAVNMGKSATEVKISVKGLKKSFGDNEVLKGLDVDIKSGEVVCVIGPSGSGKSTFLRCLNRLEDITAGSVRVDQFDLTNKDVDIDKVRRDGNQVRGDLTANIAKAITANRAPVRSMFLACMSCPAHQKAARLPKNPAGRSTSISKVAATETISVQAVEMP